MDTPTAAANPASLEELFSRDPLDLSEQDIEAVVAEQRRMRELWKAAEAAGKKQGPRPQRTTKDVKLSDLGL